MPNEVHQVDSPQDFPLIVAGDPNGAIRAPQGTLAVDNVTPALWQNANGVTTWTNIAGGGGAGGFPVGPLDDGGATQEITGTTGAIRATSTLDANAGDVAAGFVTAQGVNDVGAGMGAAGSGGGSAEIDVFVTGVPGTSRINLETDGENVSVYVVAADPNGTLTALKGSLALDDTTPALWQNTDGATAWTKLGGGATGVSGFYSGSSPTSVPDTTTTPLTWPTLGSGTALLNLGTPGVASVLADGTYTFDVGILNSSGATPISAAVQVVDGGYAAETVIEVDIAGNPQSMSITSFLHAGATVTVAVSQTSGSPINVALRFVTATKIT